MFGGISRRQILVFCCYLCLDSLRAKCCRCSTNCIKVFFIIFFMIIFSLAIFGSVHFGQLMVDNKKLTPIQHTCFDICGSTFNQADKDTCCENGSNCQTKQNCQSDRNKHYTIYFAIITSIFALIFILFIAFSISRIKKHFRRIEQQRQDRVFFSDIFRREQEFVDNQLDQSFVIDDSQSICSICLQMLNKDKVIQLNCTHIFHSKCIRQWITKKSSCPVCRNIQ